MAFDLPSISLPRFVDRLTLGSGVSLSEAAQVALYAHYQELARWNSRLGLIGPGTADEVVERHYAESLHALPLLPEGPGNLLDLGSGAGFPGFILAACRPDLVLTLVEARERKWAFLESAARRARLPCSCLNVRVRLPLPAGLPERIHVVTSRALRLDRPLLSTLGARLTVKGVVVLWTANNRPELPPELAVERELSLGGRTSRQILLLRPTNRRDVNAS